MPTHELDVPSKPARSHLLAGLLWNAFSLAYGTFSLVYYVLLVLFRKPNFRRLDEQSNKELANARDKLWNLNGRPEGLNHRFCTLRNGIKLHYIEALPHRPSAGQTSLVIFLHGFPDSWVLWQQYLRSCSKLRDNSIMVACDLPGYGGSDSLANYGSTDVLEAISEYIIQMREQYISPEDENARVVLAAHDWGALLAFRLASEAPELADRFILSNSVYPALAQSNAKGQLACVSQMLRTWLRNPLRLTLLRWAFSSAYLLFRQLVKSGYIFVFQLPRPMVNLLAAVGDHSFLRYLNALTAHPNPSKPLEGSHGTELLASSLGPSLKECIISGKEGMAYPTSVRVRSQKGAWFEKVRLYRDGLASSRWDKSLETLWDLTQLQPVKVRRRSSSGAALFNIAPEGALWAPTTVIWGQDDVAIEPWAATDCIKDFFACKSSQLVVIHGCGHWTPVEKQGASVFEEVIAWAVGGEVGSLNDKLGDDYPLSSIVTEI